MPKQPIIFPWLRACSYFTINAFVVLKGLHTGTWNRSEEDYNDDGQPEVVTVRTRDVKGRIIRVEVVDNRDANDNKTVLLDYDREGRVVRLEMQQSVRPNTTTYEYDIRDRLVRETSTTKSQDGHLATVIATHSIGAGGVIASTRVQTESGRLREVRQYTSFQSLRSLTGFDDDGNIFLDEQYVFDRHQRETKRVSRTYTFDSETSTSRLSSEMVVETVFRPRSARPTHLLRTDFREMDLPGGVRKWMKSSQETTIYAPPRGGIQKFEYQNFSPDEAGSPQLVERRTIESQIDSMGRETEFVETNTNLQTGVSKSLRSVIVFGTITITSSDLGQDGIDEESTVICDESGRVIASRIGKPDDGPFSQRQSLTYNKRGELAERRTFTNDSGTPAHIVKYW